SGYSRAGKSSSARDLESDIRVGLLGIWIEDGSKLARTARHEPRSEMGRCDIETIAFACQRWCLSGSRELSADLYGTEPRPSVNARRVRGAFRRKCRQRDDEANPAEGSERVAMGQDLGLGLSDDCDDCCATGRARHSNR